MEEEKLESPEIKQIEAENAAESKRGTNKAEASAIAKKLFKRYFIDAFSGMAQGLFVTLIAGTILAQIGGWIGNNAFGKMVTSIATIAKMLMGAGIGVGIAHSMKAPKLVMFTAAVAGLVGAFADKIIAGTFVVSAAPGNPVGAYVVAVLATEIGLRISGKTPVDILLVPLGMMIVCLGGIYLSWPFIKLIDLIAKGISLAVLAEPVSTGIIIAVCMGILLTLPTSSAAIWISIAASTAANPEAIAIAGGAAVVGCAAHMVGFAVQSFRENKWGGLVAQGLGTSMLQIPNLMRNPRILIPPIVASAVVGPLATAVFKLRCNAAGGGMGTSGLVGVFGAIEATAGTIPDWQLALGIILLMFVLPAAICLGVSELLRKVGWIKYGDQKLEL